MSVNEIVPFLIVDDMSKSIAFYVDRLGFEISNEWRVDGRLRWCRIQLDGAGLMLQQPIHARERDRDPKGRGVRLCLFCDDAVALHRQFSARGVHADEPYVGNALWVTAVVDPDGYHLDFESPTDLPEDTRLSDIETGD